MLGPADAPPPAGSTPAPRIVAETLAHGGGQRLRVLDADGRPLSQAALLLAWRQPDGAALRRQWTTTLAGLPYAAAFWELPPWSARSRTRPFECVVLDAPALAAKRDTPDRDSFARAWKVDDGTPFAVFDNLGGDARLIAPRPAAHPEPVDCRHLLAWLRSAPAGQADALWSRIATELLARVDEAPVWTSTSGLGVHWLHVRLDARPKYYGHRPYADPRWSGSEAV
jgi:hypothetical protein